MYRGSELKLLIVHARGQLSFWLKFVVVVTYSYEASTDVKQNRQAKITARLFKSNAIDSGNYATCVLDSNVTFSCSLNFFPKIKVLK